MNECRRFRSGGQRGRRWLLLPLALGLSTCGGTPGALIDIGTWPEQAESLRVEGTLDGVPFTEPFSFEFGTTRFVIYVPEERRGQLSLNLKALDHDGCPRASAQTQVEVGSGLRRVAEASVTLAPLTSPYCPAPRLSGISPASGVNRSQTLITLTGTGFLSGARVTVGGADCTNVTVASSTKITCLAPAKAATCGAQPVVVTNPDKQPATGVSFAYRALSLSFPSPMNLSGGGTGQRQLVAADA